MTYLVPAVLGVVIFLALAGAWYMLRRGAMRAARAAGKASGLGLGVRTVLGIPVAGALGGASGLLASPAIAVMLTAGTLGAVFAFLVISLWSLARGGSVERGTGATAVWVIGAAIFALLSAIVLAPAFFALLASRGVHTRTDERAYRGPVIDENGIWQLQTRATIRDNGGEAFEPDRDRSVEIEAADGLRVHGYHIQAKVPEESRFLGICVHGLFRGAMEVETVGSMMRDLGGEVLLLEMRNHGGSNRAAPGFGLHEKDDVIGAVRWAIRELPARQPIVLFGVSLGSSAVMFAVPELRPDERDRIFAVILDSPMAVAGDAAQRRLGGFMPWPARDVFLRSLEMWCGFDLDQIRPIDAVKKFPEQLETMVVAGTEDTWMPPSEVQKVVEALPKRTSDTLWQLTGVGHGRAFVDHANDYKARLSRFVAGAINRRLRQGD